MDDWRTKGIHMGLLWLRVLTGLGMAGHGYGKVFGGHMDRFAEGVAAMGFPAPLAFAWAAALSEFAGGACLILGLGTRFAAGFIAFTMGVAAFVRHAPDPFQKKELAFAYLTVSVALCLMGPGPFSIDQRLRKR